MAHIPTGNQIDQWINEDLYAIRQGGLEKLGIPQQDLVQEPMVIYGPLFWSTYGIPDDELVRVKDRNNVLRFSCYDFVVVYLSQSRISTYSGHFNFLRYVVLNEKVVEFLYRDIVSVSTEEISTNYDLPNGQKMTRAQVFRLAVPSTDNIQVVIGSPEIKNLFDGEARLNNYEQSIRAIREMLRSKKG